MKIYLFENQYVKVLNNKKAKKNLQIQKFVVSL